MKAPTCQLCRKEHWSTQPCTGQQWPPLNPVVSVKCSDCEMKEEEIARLKRLLAEAHRNDVTPAVTVSVTRNAERQRRYRDRKKAGAAT